MKKSNTYYNSGLKKNLHEQYTEAIADYTKAIELEPEHVDAYLQRGTLNYKILKKYEEALADFEKAVELDSQCSAAFLHRGVVKCHLLKFKEALPDFDRAAELTPNDEKIYFNRGKNKFMLKYEKEDVCADLEKAILLGAPQAADMLDIFYGKDGESVRKVLAGRAAASKREKSSRDSK
ncbi:MAG: tetratricopeptide repeat protein [Candidatus Aminicenantes bacterium]|nr:tetratricopeptide repeat protein [Candidatus Aminicenantes bacterium]